MSRLFAAHAVALCIVAVASNVPLAGAASAQTPYELGARVGYEVDAEEREYFGLFPRVQEAAPFRLDTIYGDSVRVLGERDSVLWKMSWDEAEALGRIADSFEDHASVASNPFWSASHRFVHLIDARTPVPQAQFGSKVQLSTDQARYEGFVLYTTDSLLVFSETVPARDPDLPGAFVFDRDEIVSMERARTLGWEKWGPYLGAISGVIAGSLVPKDRPLWSGYGLVVGSTFGTLASRLGGGRGIIDRTDALDRVTYFNEHRAPELPGPEVAERLRDRPALGARSLPKPARRYEWVSVGVHGTLLSEHTHDLPTLSGFQVLDVENGEPVQIGPNAVRQYRPNVEASVRFDVAVRPLPWIRAGAYIGKADSIEAGYAGGGALESVLTRPSSFRPYVEGVLPLPNIGGWRLEVSAGAGRESHSLQVVQREPAMQLNYPVELNAGQTTEMETSGWFQHAGIELYTTPMSSLYARVVRYTLPSMDIEPLVSMHRTYAPLMLRYTDAHTIDFGYTEVMFGARAHF